jgi:ABC-type polysaccharide/polyol phosphate transport system ATPase subunit
MNVVAKPFRDRGLQDNTKTESRCDRDFLALDNVGFSVEYGETLGVMGHNGAGKSTLLKILSRITEPSSGAAKLYGRVGSLLEVGTGFHSELSGRENIYLSGAILGMKKREIDDRFDEIVSFAEVEEFIETAIKHYSTGMQLRLAFAVAAHLQPEILLIDEVLAVGDAKFQRKCLGKMGDVAAEGRTVLFVSHNLSAMKELCRTGLVLSHGRLLFQGPIVEAISLYTQSTQETDVANYGTGWQHFEMTKPTATDWVIRSGDATSYRAVLTLPTQYAQGQVMFAIHDWAGGLMVRQLYDIGDRTGLSGDRCCIAVTASIPPLWLAPGLYTVHFKFLGRSVLGVEPKYASERHLLDVRGWSQERLTASLSPDCEWSVQAMAAAPSNTLLQSLESPRSAHRGPHESRKV